MGREIRITAAVGCFQTSQFGDDLSVASELRRVGRQSHEILQQASEALAPNRWIGAEVEVAHAQVMAETAKFK